MFNSETNRLTGALYKRSKSKLEVVMKRLFFLFFGFLVVFWLFESTSSAKATVVLASWYGSPVLEGTPMANGEPFKAKDKTTAAHPTLPFGTRLHVKNPDNGRELMVVVKDRGPFVNGRGLDLSLAAAKHLDYIHKGVTRLMVVVQKQK